MPTIFTDEDVQRYTRWQRFKMFARIRNGCTWDVRSQLLFHYQSSSRHWHRSQEAKQRFDDADADNTDLPALWLVERLNEDLASERQVSSSSTSRSPFPDRKAETAFAPTLQELFE